MHINACVPGSSVGIATELQAGRSGDRIPVGARFSAPVQIGPGAHPASCTMGTGSFPGVKGGRGVTLTPHSLPVPWSRKIRAIPLFPPWAVRPVQSLSACKRVHFTFFILMLEIKLKEQAASAFYIMHYWFACLPVSEILIICLTSVLSTFLNGSITMCS